MTNEENDKLLHKGIKLLILIFSILFTSFFTELYQSPYSVPNSLITVMLNLGVSIVIGTVVFIILFKIIEALRDHDKNLDRIALNLNNTKYALFTLVIFILFSLFSNQSVSLISPSEPNGAIVQDIAISPDFSKLAYYTTNSKQLNVENTITKTHEQYSLCISKENCIIPKYISQGSIKFINDSLICFLDSHYLLNLDTKNISFLDFHYNLYSSVLINSSWYYVNTFSSLGTYPNSKNYIQLTNIFTNSVFNIILPDYQYYYDEQAYFSSDFKNFALNNYSNTINFFTLENGNNSIAKRTSTFSAGNNNYFHMISWVNPELVYFSRSNSSSSELIGYNFTSSLINDLILNKSYNINSVDLSNSYFSTYDPFQIFSFKDQNIRLIKKEMMVNTFLNPSFTKVISYDSKSIDLYSFNPTTTVLKPLKSIYSIWIPTNEFNTLKMIPSFNFNLVIINIVVVFILVEFENVGKKNSKINQKSELINDENSEDNNTIK